MNYPVAITSRRMQFCAGPEKHTFYACRECLPDLEAGDVQLFLRLPNEPVQPVSEDEEIRCDLCREG